MPLWIIATIFAACMQAVRTAGQKQLSQASSPFGATAVRYLHGLPMAWLYFAVLAGMFGLAEGWPGPRYYLMCLIAGALQVMATVILVHMFSLRHFAVANMYIKAEVILTAIIGSIFFTEVITGYGWVAILIAFSGLIVLTIAKQGWVSPIKLITEPSALFGLLAASMFAFTGLCLRDATQQVEHLSPIMRAGTVLATMVSMQSLICTVWLVGFERATAAKLWRMPGLSSFVALTSLLGSAGWFTAMAMISVSYVKTLGQIELIIMMVIGIVYFREYPKRLEWLGFALLLSGILLLLVKR